MAKRRVELDFWDSVSEAHTGSWSLGRVVRENSHEISLMVYLIKVTMPMHTTELKASINTNKYQKTFVPQQNKTLCYTPSYRGQVEPHW